MSKIAFLAGGTTFAYDAAGDGTMVVVPGIASIGGVGDQTEAKDKTLISDTRKVYGSALPDAPDKAIKGQFFSTDEIQKGFIAKCKKREEFDVEVAWPDGTKAKFKLQTLGFMLDEVTAEDWQTFTVSGKQNTDAEWTEPTPAE